MPSSVLQAPTVAQFHTWELVVIVVDGVALALLFAMAGAVCLAVVHWRRKQRVRLLRVGQFGDDEVCTDHGRTGVSSPILYKDIVITELLGRGTFTLVHRAHLGYQEVVIKTLKGMGVQPGCCATCGRCCATWGTTFPLCRQPLRTGAV